MCIFSHLWLFVTQWIAAHHDPLSMEFSRQEYWSGLSFPFPGNLSDSGIKPGSPAPSAAAAAPAKSLKLCPTLQLHRRQRTRLPCPWDAPGKNTGVGCHFLLQCMKVKSESEVVQSCLTISDPMDCSLPGSSIHGIFQARVLEWVAIAFSDTSCIGSQFIATEPPRKLFYSLCFSQILLVWFTNRTTSLGR